MPLQFRETFQVQAPAERVWSYLVDPQQVVHCLPGAELLEVQDQRTFLGRVKVKLGPVTAAYRGKARFVELDPATRVVRMEGEGQETGGGGSARMSMSSRIVELPDGGAEVQVDVEMDVVGKLVQFGRGMIEEVSRQLFRQFAACVQAELAREAAQPAPTASETVPAAEGSDEAAPQPAAASATAVAAPKAPVNALGLVLRAILAWSRRVFDLQRRQKP